MSERSEEILKELKRMAKPPGHFDLQTESLMHIRTQSALLGELAHLTAKEQSQAADKMEKHTLALVSLTRWLLGLTVALLALTVYMTYLSQKNQPVNQQAEQVQAY